jgi:hypothetical protein
MILVNQRESTPLQEAETKAKACRQKGLQITSFWLSVCISWWKSVAGGGEGYIEVAVLLCIAMCMRGGGYSYLCVLNSLVYTANNFPFMYSQKRFGQASLLISTTYFQNRIIMFCLELCYSVETYNTRCSHSAVSIGNNIFPNGVMKLL